LRHKLILVSCMYLSVVMLLNINAMSPTSQKSLAFKADM